jgi:hypothetical protein
MLSNLGTSAVVAMAHASRLLRTAIQAPKPEHSARNGFGLHVWEDGSGPPFQVSL